MYSTVHKAQQMGAESTNLCVDSSSYFLQTPSYLAVHDVVSSKLALVPDCELLATDDDMRATRSVVCTDARPLLTDPHLRSN